ncbi:hypothetical protein [Mycobacterium uberis]|uniref:hypothetical protein n=1 Tax=Mycobacterium uberis TaxID=2162698 RepID=UPI001058944E|nr:hypothetical protein [Mycobacterium uberis]
MKVHLALDAARYLAADFKLDTYDGFSSVRRRIFELEIARAHMTTYQMEPTSVVVRLVQQFASVELTSQGSLGVLSGRIQLGLGYIEPDGGNDIAICKF